MGWVMEAKGKHFKLAVSEIQTRKRYVESLPRDKRTCFSQGERSTVQLPLDRGFPKV